ncbi:MAG: hypothetical protein GY694_14835 [Gammaproteobacteria bacterium]|nr:hypothetical protein [Gammaproteobacteria bacterium]
MSGTMSLGGGRRGGESSSELLTKMQARKRVTTAVHDDDDDFLRPDLPSGHHDNHDPRDNELLQDIRNYVAFMAARDGEATTQEIVLNFGKRLPKADAPKFKAMLNQICDFQNGLWMLKCEFR